MRNSSFFLLLLSLSLSTGLRAQNNAGIVAAQNDQSQQDSIGAVLTLPQAVTIAIKNNLAVAQSDLSSQNYKIGFDQSWEYMLPTVGASGGQQINFGRTINSSTSNQYITSQFNAGSGSISAGLLLFHGLELQNNYRAQRYAYNASKMDLQQQKDNITLSVLLAYLQVLSSRDQLALAYEQARTDSVTLDLTTAKGREGALNPVSNLTDLQGKYASDQVNIAGAINTLETNKVALFALLNVPYKRDVEYQNSITATDVNDYQASSDSIFQHALGIIPSIRSAQLKVQEYQRLLAYYRGAYYPSISLNGGVSTNWTNVPAPSSFVQTGAPYYVQNTDGFYSDPNGNNIIYSQKLPGYSVYPKFGDQFKDNRSEYVGISVNIPILNGFQARNNVRQAKLNLKNYELQSANQKNYVQQQVELAFQNMMAAYKSLKFYQQEATAFDESFRVTNIRFKEGVIASDAYILAKGNADQAEVNLAAAKYVYIFRTKVLDYYQGKLTIQ
jgi:outer membrane protein